MIREPSQPVQPMGWPINAYRNQTTQALQVADRERARVEQSTRRNRRLRTVAAWSLVCTITGMAASFALGSLFGYSLGSGLLRAVGRMTTTVRDRRSFPGLLADLREHAGWSQSRLAVEAGYDASYICQLEKGKRTPSRDTVGALAEVLELDADDTGRLFISANYLPAGRWVWFSGWCIRPEQEAPA